jgi:O2-independent ubiquinone biosynthesis accessory factor UbiT
MLPLPRLEPLVPILVRPLRWVPHPVQRAPLELVLEETFRASVAAGGLDFLEGRCLSVEMEDTGWRWPVALEQGRLRVRDRDHPADVAIRGATPAFIALAARLEDPDTLFFQRRLVIEGDTELGLGVKNFLDGLDEQQLPLPVRHALGVLRRLGRSLGRRT